MVLASNKIKSNFEKNKQNLLIFSLHNFITSYEENDQQLKAFIAKAVKSAILSITNFKDLKLSFERNNNSNSNNNKKDLSESELHDRFIKLEVRVKALFENLNLCLKKDCLNIKTISFLNMLITPNLGIPFKVYTKFELTRLKLSDITIIEINENQAKMILIVYILIKILIKNILIDVEITKSKSKDMQQ